jgi:UDP-N-acetylglucosamine:LPS N-acetylglucosamine transferase
MKRNLLFLYLKTGGGHLSPARALAETIGNEYGEKYQIELVDGLTGAIKPAQWLIEDGYRVSINYAKWIFETLYFFNKYDLVAQMSLRLFAPVAQKIISDHIIKSNSAGIVIFHYFLIHPVYEALNQLNISVPVQVVVTDPFTAHPIWFLDKRPEFIVFSNSLRNQLIQKGFSPEQVRYFPQIISAKFERLPDESKKNRLKKQLGMNPHLKTILIFGGGDGMKKGLAIFKRLLKAEVRLNIIMVCGRNSLMQTIAEKYAEDSGLSGVSVFGFVENVNELLAISDVAVSKCGASALAEMLVAGKVSVIVDYIWEQEKGNLEFILQNHLGLYEPNPDKAVERIIELSLNDKLYEKFANAIREIAYKNGSPEIAKFLADIFCDQNDIVAPESKFPLSKIGAF